MTLPLIGVVVLGLVLTMGAARLGGVLVARARADAAADAAALAGADMLALGRGSGAASNAASRAASSNGARLVSCECDGDRAVVTVEVSVPGPGAVAGPARGHAAAEVRRECVLGACRGR